MSIAQRIVIYHEGCADGFCSAWIAHKKYPDAEYFPTHYGCDPPPVRGRDVLILDFSYERDVLEQLHAEANSLRVYDHHKTVKENLEGLSYCIFDMNKCAAGMTWDAFFDMDPPWLVKYVEDRDLWKWELENSRQINAAIASYPHEFDAWDEIRAKGPKEIIEEGQAILRWQQRKIQIMCKDLRIVEFQGYKIPAVNSRILHSEIGDYLRADYPFVIIWFRSNDGQTVIGMRSNRDNGVDVGALAKQFPGGGGHTHASGFTVPVDGDTFGL